MTAATAFDDTLEQITQGQHVSLTTYRKDGRTVATPLWFIRDGEQLIVMTAPDSGKVRRLRNNQSVVIAPCDSQGRITDGAPRAEATAVSPAPASASWPRRRMPRLRSAEPTPSRRR
jgi:uncharacterized protein